MNKFNQLAQSLLSENSDQTYQDTEPKEIKAFDNSPENVTDMANAMYRILRNPDFVKWFDETFKGKHLVDNTDRRGMILKLKDFIHFNVR
jgi:hypothetical protein